jgi:hypothetical protein
MRKSLRMGIGHLTVLCRMDDADTVEESLENFVVWSRPESPLHRREQYLAWRLEQAKWISQTTIGRSSAVCSNITPICACDPEPMGPRKWQR